MSKSMYAIAVAAAAFIAASAAADEKGSGTSGSDTAVYTRAVVRSLSAEANGKVYVRLKLLPRSKIPFSTQTFLVADRSLLAGIAEGASVKFTAKHLDGENTLTSIHAVEPCRRFQPCE